MSDPITKLKELRKILDYPTAKEVAEAFGSVLSVVKEMRVEVSKEIEELEKEAEKTETEMCSKMEGLNYGLKECELKLEKLITESRQFTLAEVQNAVKELTREIEKCKEMIPEVPDLSDRLAEIEAKIPTLKELEPLDLRDKLESLKGDDRLDISAIKGFGKRITKFGDDLLNRAIGILDQRTSFLIQKLSNLSTRVDNISVTGGGHTIQDEGVSLTQRTNLNFVGTGVAVTDDAGNDATKVTINAGGGGVTVETPGGAVDATNTTYTVTVEPLWVVADGVTYFDGSGYTYAALSVEMDIAPSQFIRSIS